MNPRVCVISGSRAEFGLLKNVITPLIKSNILDLQLLITGSHTSKVYGETINEIKEEGFQIDKIVDIKIANTFITGVLLYFRSVNAFMVAGGSKVIIFE